MNVWGNRKQKYNKREDLEKGWVNGAPDKSRFVQAQCSEVGRKVEKKREISLMRFKIEGKDPDLQWQQEISAEC